MTALRHEVTGRPGAAAVVLSAGLGGLAGFWKPQRAALEEHLQVVAFDQRGTGSNAGPLPGAYAIADMADDVVRVLDAAGIARAHFLGHALGGLVGLELARRHPGRLARLVAVNAWAKVEPHSERCFDIRLGILEAQGPAAYVAAQPLFLHTAPYMAEHSGRMDAEIARGIAGFQGERNLRRRIAALRAFDARADLPAIAAPTLVAASRDDLLVPWTASRHLAEALPDARLWLTEHGGHAFTVEQPEPFNQVLLDFLLAG
ncbi:Hydrolase/acyltransferase family protein [Roseomonas mucosa]|uniref:Putative carbamate hydrolase RutD n=1 Tax=Roseomonas mucosa TaxID=207340 RepID=A0A1S8D647_9PROT|nr:MULTISPECIES: pyrimidine utilization protein D [Roseomonas]MBS5903636.1 pyrimidine utilization protein D [Acetobacteraceae bacterium]MDT8266470.1 pyrimidine utilization protein D [Roseomonas sp. DSM 102946]ATR21684.1 pyrimidine utilization protein D [Roseomonas sp. FDAARGOS_362]AWV21620.1 Hydrolase/acyltransferase family protein [Roseomonas mucosa]MCG7350548.1 pyrimidine utilization protein D [Roseomonas mucosa]